MTASISFSSTVKIVRKTHLTVLSSFEALGHPAVSNTYQTIRFRGYFGLFSPYKGLVTQEAIAQWSKIEESKHMASDGSIYFGHCIAVGAISISEAELRKLNASKRAVKVPPNLGGGYVALPDFKQ